MWRVGGGGVPGERCSSTSLMPPLPCPPPFPNQAQPGPPLLIPFAASLSPLPPTSGCFCELVWAGGARVQPGSPPPTPWYKKAERKWQRKPDGWVGGEEPEPKPSMRGQDHPGNRKLSPAGALGASWDAGTSGSGPAGSFEPKTQSHFASLDLSFLTHHRVPMQRGFLAAGVPAFQCHSCPTFYTPVTSDQRWSCHYIQVFSSAGRDAQFNR